MYKVTNAGKTISGTYTKKGMENMEKKKIAWTLLTALAISLVIVAGSMTSAIQQEHGMAQELTTEEPPTESGYLLRIESNQLALFRTGSSVPYQRLDVPLNLLSDYDLEQLQSGIAVGTEAEMRQLVEDLTS